MLKLSDYWVLCCCFSKLYSWGVNNNPNMTWGWMKAMEPADCPHQVETWRVWSSASSSWLPDDSLSVVCVRNL